SEGDQLDLHDFPLLASQPQSATEIPTAPLMLEPMASATMVSGNEIPIAPLPLAGGLNMLTASGDVRPLEDMEHEIIR
ncbi:hypothetical protein ABTB22_20070, partial [Acinetobacter baumannii]